MNNKHRAFIDEYFKTGPYRFNATAAYKAVYHSKTDEAAAANASRLLRNDKVSAEIERRMDELHMSAEEALALHAEIARGDMADFLDPDTLILDIRKAKEAGKTKLIKKIKQRTTIKLGKNESDDDIEVHDLEIELYPADTAQDRILKVHGKYKDLGTKENPFYVENTNDEQFNRALSSLADALRESLSGTGAEQEDEVDTTE